MSLHPQALRVQSALNQAGCAAQVRELPDSTRTAAEAAQAVGCQIGQIVKSLVFALEPAGALILVLVSGSNRVDEKAFGQRLNGRLVKANADQVQQATGYVIGGVPPLGHARPMPVYIDQDLLQYDVVWAAGGTPHAVFPIEPQELVRITGGEVLSVR